MTHTEALDHARKIHRAWIFSSKYESEDIDDLAEALLAVERETRERCAAIAQRIGREFNERSEARVGRCPPGKTDDSMDGAGGLACAELIAAAIHRGE